MKKFIFVVVVKRYFTCHSYDTTPIPVAAPDPASPTKCSLPILLAKRLGPT
jgi:hypothetical protein